MRIVTLEEHVLTADFAAATRKLVTGPPAKLRARMEPALLEMGAARIHAMDEAGVDTQVLSLAADGLDALPLDEAAALARSSNDQVAAAVTAYPDRFAGFATVALGDIDAAVHEIYRAITELRFAGIRLYGTARGISLDDEHFEPVWAAVEALQAPVYLYPGPPPPAVEQAYYSGLSGNTAKLMSIAAWGWHAETGVHILRLIVSGLFDRHPGLQLIVGHVGENLPPSIAHAGSVLDQIGQKLYMPVEKYFHRHFWITTSGYFSPLTFSQAVESIGIDRMLFSIEYPFSSMIRGRDFLNSLVLSPEDRKKLAHGNADCLLKLSAGIRELSFPLPGLPR